MRSKVFRVLTISVLILSVVTCAALLAMSVTGNEMRAQAKERISAYRESSVEPHVVAYNPHNLIRFHVIANSDSDRDQALKRRVRDLIVQKMTPEFSKANNLNDARKIARTHLKEIEEVAQKEVGLWGEKYPVRVQLGNFDFPVKTYGKLTLPAGNYEAVRVVIGQGQGANWWCVLFPPLCFVDVSRAMAPAQMDYVPDAVYTPEGGLKSQDKHNLALSNNDFGQKNVKIKFKLLEWLGW